jgi:metal-sulfur cluster biosynthetic enzyme
MSPTVLQNAILERLARVIDPETGTDVVRMQLVQNLVINENGKVAYNFRPSSPLCPIAVPLAVAIIQAINEIDGVSGQSMTVIDYIEADKLNEILRSIL